MSADITDHGFQRFLDGLEGCGKAIKELLIFLIIFPERCRILLPLVTGILEIGVFSMSRSSSAAFSGVRSPISPDQRAAWPGLNRSANVTAQGAEDEIEYRRLAPGAQP